MTTERIDQARGVEGQRRLAELEAEGSGLASQISQLQARLVEVTAEVQALEGLLSGMTASAWTTWRFGLTPREGGQLNRLAARLPKLPVLAAAFEAGRVSAGLASSIAAVATPENEAGLVETTKVASGAQLQTLLRSYKKVRAAENPVPEESYRGSTDDRGWWAIRAHLNPENGAQVDAAVRAAMAVDKDQEPDPLERFDDWNVRRPDEGRRSTHADGLVRLARSFMDERATRYGVLSDRFHTIIHVDADRAHDGGHVRGTGHVGRTILDQLLCESVVSYVFTHQGRPVTATSPTRLATPDQTRALLVRDRCCRVPGCGREHDLVAHHVVYDRWHGPTRLDNLLLLCRKHHQMIHVRRWRIELTDGGMTVRFFRPDGTEMPAAAPRTPPDPSRPPPSPGPRHRGTGDHLTQYGQDVLLHEWLDPGGGGQAA